MTTMHVGDVSSSSPSDDDDREERAVLGHGEGPMAVDPFTEKDFGRLLELKGRPVILDVTPSSSSLSPSLRVKQQRPKGIASPKWQGKVAVPTESLEESLLEPLASLADVHFYAQTPRSITRTTMTVAAHVLGRILAARRRIIQNNQALRLLYDHTGDSDLRGAKMTPPRDQGFTRCSTVILVPMRSGVVRFVQALEALLTGTKTNSERHVQQRRRFEGEFGTAPEELQAQREAWRGKPPSYRDLFAGNNDDCFRLGVKVTRRALRLFTGFYDSDIILASPLGLKLAIQGEEARRDGEHKDGDHGHDKRRRKHSGEDWDFLSSVQTLIVDQAESLLMQNWEHVGFVVEHVNRRPQDVANVVDLRRVLSVHLEDGLAAQCRQTILLSAIPFLESCHLWATSPNILGRIRLEPDGYSDRILRSLRLHGVNVQLHPFECSELTDEPKQRLALFRRLIVPRLLRLHHVAVVCGSYFDCVQVGQLLREVDVSYVGVDEYDGPAETTRKRAHFFHGLVRVLVTTERFHHFKRVRLRGIRRLVVYSLPEHVDYVVDWMDMLLLPQHHPNPGPNSSQKPGSDPGTKIIEPSRKRVYDLPILVNAATDHLKLERFLGSEEFQKLLI